MSLRARLKKLERQQNQVSREPFRLVITRAGERFDLVKATCSRTLMPDGQLIEIVKLPGGCDSMSDEDLERFIQSHPIKGPL